jgi:glycosyltransferase involved in cell wall biosynthesis
MIEVGLIFLVGKEWQGGLSYFHNLLGCYRKYPDAALHLKVFAANTEDIAHYRSDAIEIHSCPEVFRHNRWNYPRRVTRRLLGYDLLSLRFIERQKIDLMTHNSLGSQTSVRTLPWTPDLQHKAFPQFFTSRQRAARDSSISNAHLWGHILLSSHAAGNDFRRYYPDLASVQMHVLHFSSAAALNVEPMSRGELEVHYPVHEPYFFLPNQFWQHKNHAVVVEALRQTPPEIRVICTGLMQDFRDATYVPSLLDTVRQAGLDHRFICLGMVPYPTMVSLMHHSIAVLQPSLFEGWSTSVEESKAMRKEIILSNLAVHLEQAPERGVFFSPDSPEELAACMKRVQAEFCPATEEIFAEQRQFFREGIERDWIQDYARIVKRVSVAPS